LGGGSGHGNGGGQGQSGKPVGGINLSLFPEAQASVAYGTPVNISLIEGVWGLSVFRAVPVQQAVAAALATLEQHLVAGLPYAGRLAGLTFGLLMPSPIAPDDKRMMARIVTTLPAQKITDTPVASLPVQQATVSIKQRVVDMVKDERQHLAVMAGKPMSVPLVNAKPTKRPGVFTASVVPGMPELHIKTEAGKPASLSQSQGITQEKGDVMPAGFTAGGNTHDAIIRFPATSGQEPVYVSVTDLISVEELKKQQEEERRRQQAWDAAHPLEAAEREYLTARADFTAADSVYQQQKNTLDTLKTSAEGLALTDAARHPIKSSTTHKIYVTESGFRGEMVVTTEATIDNQTHLNYLLAHDGLAYKRNILKDTKVVLTEDEEGDKAIYKAEYQEYDKLRQRLLDTRNKIATAEKALSTALESRRQKEKQAQDAENKLKKEKAKAAAKVQADAEAAAKAKAQAEAKAKAQALTEAKARLEAAMPASNAIVLGNLPGTLEFTIAGYGTWSGSSATENTIARELTIGGKYYISNLTGAPALVKNLESALARGTAALLSSASLSATVSIANIWSLNAGAGSDKVPLMLSLPLNTLTGKDNHLQPGTRTAELPVRASLAEEHNHPVLKLLKTAMAACQKPYRCSMSSMMKKRGWIASGFRLERDFRHARY